MVRSETDSPEAVSFYDKSSNTHFLSLFLLGKGGFARCYKVRNERTNEYWALKVIDKKKFGDTQYQKVLREINIHRSLSHPNIVRLERHFEDVNNVYIQMELCSDITLLALIAENKNGIAESEAQYYMKGIVNAVQFILSRKIIHRDIKPGNILLSSGSRSTVKLADFGLACPMEQISTVSVSGTPNYLAPEVLARKGHSAASESWSLGCLLFCMVVGIPPFDSGSVQETYKKINKGEYIYPTACSLSSSLKQLVDGLLMVDPQSRTRVEDILSSPFMKPPPPPPKKELRRPPPQTTTCVPSIPPTPSLSSSKSLHSSTSYHNNNYLCRASSYGLDSTRSQLDTSSGSLYGRSVSPTDHLTSILDAHSRTLRSLVSRVQSLSPVDTIPLLHISKWVDYSNRYGFGALLSDGTVSVKFNGGEAVSITRDENGVFIPSTFSTPIPFHRIDNNAWRLVDVAKTYRQYMDINLANAVKVEGTTERPTSARELVYVSHYVKKRGCIMMILSNGVTQMNYLSEHMKVILSPLSSMSLVSIIDSDGVLKSFRPASSSPPDMLSTFMEGILRETSQLLENETLFLKKSPLPPLVTLC